MPPEGMGGNFPLDGVISGEALWEHFPQKLPPSGFTSGFTSDFTSDFTGDFTSESGPGDF